ncbi:hypothetical protein ES288_A12G114900v1 [Gossypium darwinii]|uniref:Uncharacterized protein n=1 Tax=Gossypium darwinii TaxID=34276 RepID=A0A5D2E8I3_GOSDA|nr:hypothetical protein ES288_A12G114900v1 [Gossypium darwinii]
MVLCPTVVLLPYFGELHHLKAWFALFKYVLEGFAALKLRNPHLYFDYCEASKDSKVNTKHFCSRRFYIDVEAYRETSYSWGGRS